MNWITAVFRILRGRSRNFGFLKSGILPAMAEEKGKKEGAEDDEGGESEEEKARKLQSDMDAYANKQVAAAEKRLRKEYKEENDRREKKSEQNKLKEEGKTEELLQAREEENAELRSREAQRAFQDKIRSQFKEKGIEEFVDVVLGDLSTEEGIASVVDSLKEMIKSRVESDVKEALDTDDLPQKGKLKFGDKGSKSALESMKISEMDVSQKVTYTREFGKEAFDKKVAAENAL